MRERILKSRRVYQGRVVVVRVDHVLEPGGVRTVRELVLHPGSVVVLPVLEDGRVVLIRQYRHAAGQALWELVAGALEPGEKPLEAAARELEEETGYKAKSFTPVLDYFSSPGFLAERMYLVQASGLTRHQAHPEADERIRVRIFTRRELVALLRAKRIRDGKTLVGILWHLGQHPTVHRVNHHVK